MAMRSGRIANCRASSEALMNLDRIEKYVVLPTARSLVWKAVSDTTEFGRWFGIEFKGAFIPGAVLVGRVTNPGFENMKTEVVIERVEPERLLSWRWHPAATDSHVNYALEPKTLVVFELADRLDGTLFSVTESGFDQLPEVRRQKAHV